MGRRTRGKAPNSSVMRAVAQFIHNNGPSTVDNIVENAVFKSGKPLRMSRLAMTARQLSGTLSAHKDFFIFHRQQKKGAAEWAVEPTSKLLVEYLNRKDSSATAAKKKKLGKKAYAKQLKARRKTPSYNRPRGE